MCTKEQKNQGKIKSKAIKSTAQPPNATASAVNSSVTEGQTNAAPPLRLHQPHHRLEIRGIRQTPASKHQRAQAAAQGTPAPLITVKAATLRQPRFDSEKEHGVFSS
ncbi:unnamed protein product [Vicia faba]|uniref:Uncharacterized protein n=1 Tax=Vicia faba TaxID=3906 RepID=A0AAV1AXX4_VICFA|nr:unnamed protein product [Vicia faba]